MSIIAPIPRTERRLMQKTIHKTKDKNHARRLTAMLMLHRGDTVSHVARTLCCARSSIGRWINWFTLSGAEGLKSLPSGRGRRWPFEHICALLRELVKHSPGDFGYQRSRWSTELLAIKIRDITGCPLHASTIRRWLPAAGLVWRRAAPTLRIRDPHKEEKMVAIHEALAKCSAENPVFYEDEVDIHLNPKIGADWQLRGQQKRVVTPGQNEKYYLAGALHSGTGKVSYVGGNSKGSSLFIRLLKHLKATYRRAKTITLIVDNYIIHKSRETLRWLKANPKFRVIYQPIYSPWVNHVERLWQALHETITRNHQCSSMWQLLKKVHHFMNTVSPFPGENMGWLKCSGIRISYLVRQQEKRRQAQENKKATGIGNGRNQNAGAHGGIAFHFGHYQRHHHAHDGRQQKIQHHRQHHHAAQCHIAVHEPGDGTHNPAPEQAVNQGDANFSLKQKREISRFNLMQRQGADNHGNGLVTGIAADAGDNRH